MYYKNIPEVGLSVGVSVGNWVEETTTEVEVTVSEVEETISEVEVTASEVEVTASEVEVPASEVETSDTTEDGVTIEDKVWVEVEVSVDVGVSSTLSVVVCTFGIPRLLVETENWVEAEILVDTGVGITVEVGASDVVCIFTSCDDIRVLVETKTWVEVEVSVGNNIVDDGVVDCISSTCDEIRVLDETGEVDVWVWVGRNKALVEVEASDEIGPYFKIVLWVDIRVGTTTVVWISEISVEVEVGITAGLLVVFISCRSGSVTILLHSEAFSIKARSIFHAVNMRHKWGYDDIAS